MSNKSGFTLIEVVVAMAITVVIASFTYTSLSTSSRSAEAGETLIANINTLDRTWQILAQDLRHVLTPEAITTNGVTEIRHAFLGVNLTGESSGKQLLLKLNRHGWLNPMNRLRSDLQQVFYRLEDGVLWRDYRPDRNLPETEGLYADDLLHQELLTGIRLIELRFLSGKLASLQGESVLTGDDYARDWDETWPPINNNDATDLPLALLIRIELEKGGESARLYEIAP